MSVAVPDIPSSLVTTLVNEWGATPQEVSTRPWTGYPQADSSYREELEKVWPGAAITITDSLIAVAADRIYSVFSAAWPRGTAERLSALISEIALAPEMSADDTGIRRRWSVPDADGQLLGAMLGALVDHLAANPEAKLGICGSEDCADVYVDVSPRRNKTFCSARCQTRERVRAYRKRAV